MSGVQIYAFIRTSVILDWGHSNCLTLSVFTSKHSHNPWEVGHQPIDLGGHKG